MADDWEDWEDDNFVPKNVTSHLASSGTKDQWEGEDAEQENEQDSMAAQEQPKPKKKESGKKYADKGASNIDQPLDDPVAEKLRQQRLVEEADFAAARDLFGDGKSLDDIIPKSQKDFEEYARMVAHKYLLPHSDSGHYKTMLKALNKVAMVSLTSQETKDIETSIAGLRADKIKQEKQAVQEKKDAGKKGSINLGGRGKMLDTMGDIGEYLDDGAIYDEEDEYDFM